MTRLGFVGVGRHAQKLAAVFRELGCEIACHARAASEAAEGFGARSDHLFGADRIVICAPPLVAFRRVMLSGGTPTLVSKPLLITDPSGRDQVSVDLWRLWSPSWQALKQAVAGQRISSVRVVFTGSGPHRSTHSGALDYGPHAFAFVHDLLGELETGTNGYWSHQTHKRAGAGIWTWRTPPMGGVGRSVEVVCGNGAVLPEMSVSVMINGDEYLWKELDQIQWFIDGKDRMSNRKPEALRAFCAAWLRGDTDRTLQLSCMGMRCLKGLT